MPGKSFLRPIFIAAAIIIFAPLVLSAGEYGTVVKRDGTKYENATAIEDKDSKVIATEPGDKNNNIGFSYFGVIYENDENVIITPTPESTDKTEEEAWKSEIELKSTGGYPGEGWISLLGTFTQPLGDYYGETNGNIGFEGHLVLSIDRNTAFHGIIARPGISDDGPFGFGAMKFVAALQVNTFEAEMIPGDAIYYAVTGLGLIKYERSSDFLLHVGGGAIVIMSPNFGFDISASLGLAVAAESGSKGYGMGYVVDLRGGLTILF